MFDATANFFVSMRDHHDKVVAPGYKKLIALMQAQGRMADAQELEQELAAILQMKADRTAYWSMKLQMMQARLEDDSDSEDDE